jgi:hypothetical protein
LKKEILSDDFKKRKIFWKNIAENCLENFLWKMFHLTSLPGTSGFISHPKEVVLRIFIALKFRRLGRV